MKFLNLFPFESHKNYDLSREYEITILIKTLEREIQLIQLLDSLVKYQFLGKVIVADDSRIPYQKSIITKFPSLNITYLELPYDTGTAEGRNIMLHLVETPYFLLCDDDFVFDRKTRIPLMKKYLIKYELDILGGVFRQNNKKTRLGNYLFRLNKYLCKFGWIIPPIQYYEYHANFSISEGEIILRKVNYRTPYTRADLIHNFFIARTDMVRSFGGWNPILKGGEHQNFFIRAKLAGLKVGTTRLCGVIHDQWTNNSEEYQRLRDRGHDYQTIALEEFGFKTIDNYSKFFKGKFGK